LISLKELFLVFVFYSVEWLGNSGDGLGFFFARSGLVSFKILSQHYFPRQDEET
jgi:hypothetical protein